MSPTYLQSEPATSVEFVDAGEIHTVVQKVTDHPMSEMASVFDSTFQAMGTLLGSGSIRPVGPGFALHRRRPTDTATFEVGLPVDAPVAAPHTADNGVVLEPSVIPGGQIARVSHLGPYDGLPDAWGAFVESITAAGKEMLLPFWEVYVTEPTPDTDPSALRTDLFALVRG